MSMYLIVTNPLGLPVRPSMNVLDTQTRVLSFGAGFIAYKTFTKSATQFWAQITNKPGNIQEYVLVSIGSKSYAALHPDQPESIDIAPAEILSIYQFALAHGYTGANPFINKE